MPPPPPDTPANAFLDVGARIGGRYELMHRIARGGMAEVWEADDTVLSRAVAAKILLPHLAADAAFLTRFRREAVAAARLSHPHIVSIYDTCASDDCEAIVMELVRGRTVREALDERGPLPVRQAVDIAAQVADALAHAHTHGLIHRDVKPGNILLSEDGRVLVTDFGIAKAAEASSDLTEAGQVVGTAKYLSPEQVEGHELDARSDIYALGVVLYEMLCGRVPFDGANATATALARLNQEPLRPRQVRAGIPRRVEDVVLRAMARRPEDRYASATEMQRALLAIDLSRMEDEPTGTFETVDPTPTAGELTSFARRERSWLVPAALILVVAVTLGVVGVLVGRTQVGHDLFGHHPSTSTAPTGEPVALQRPRAFDPGGDGDHPELLGALVDGNPATEWHTHTYDTAAFGGLKPGTGVVLPLTTASDVATLTITASTTDWRARVYLADTAPSTLAGWGRPVATVTGRATTRVALGGRPAGAVLLWFTDLGPSRTVALGEVHLTR